ARWTCAHTPQPNSANALICSCSCWEVQRNLHDSFSWWLCAISVHRSLRRDYPSVVFRCCAFSSAPSLSLPLSILLGSSGTQLPKNFPTLFYQMLTSCGYVFL